MRRSSLPFAALIGILLISFALTPFALAQRAGISYIVETVAGSEPPRDAPLAVDAWLDLPRGVAADAAGNVYVSDTSNNRILRIHPDGTQETYAGTGVRGFSGDGGPADEAQLAAPLGLSVGPDGCLYVLDWYDSYHCYQDARADPQGIDRDRGYIS